MSGLAIRNDFAFLPSLFRDRAGRTLAVIVMAVMVLSPIARAAEGKTRAGRSRVWRSEKLRLSPPLGWNSWDCYGTTVTEAEVKAEADYMARHLARYGWRYIVVDIQWYEPNAKAHGYRENAELMMDGY